MPFGDYNTSFITPLSAQLNRYDFYPVSKSTGTTNINIPLFSIPTPDDTQISFNLSYHSSGIKVEDPVGILGYGWSILPGLRITRMQFGNIQQNNCLRNIFADLLYRMIYLVSNGRGKGRIYV